MVKCRDSCNLKVGREWQEQLVNLHEIKVSPVVKLTSGYIWRATARLWSWALLSIWSKSTRHKTVGRVERKVYSVNQTMFWRQLVSGMQTTCWLPWSTLNIKCKRNRWMRFVSITKVSRQRIVSFRYEHRGGINPATFILDAARQLLRQAKKEIGIITWLL